MTCCTLVAKVGSTSQSQIVAVVTRIISSKDTCCTLVTEAGNVIEAKAITGVTHIITMMPIANGVKIFGI
jgi:ABC-type transport system involved in cytochrome bd biosynthesis fused ATPase/permease subunit